VTQLMSMLSSGFPIQTLSLRLARRPLILRHSLQVSAPKGGSAQRTRTVDPNGRSVRLK